MWTERVGNCIAILVDKRSGKELNIQRYATSIGRELGNDLVISEDRTVSRQHACIQYIDGKFHFQDLGSKNGSRLNGEKVLSMLELKSGDEISIGLSQFVFVLLPARMLGLAVQSRKTETIPEPAVQVVG